MFVLCQAVAFGYMSELGAAVHLSSQYDVKTQCRNTAVNTTRLHVVLV